MTDYRSKAEKFVSDFLDYIYKNDILDLFNNRTQKMERSPGIEKLIAQAENVFPPRVLDGTTETNKLTPAQVEQAVTESENVIDTREMFARKIQRNGAARGLLEAVLEGDEDAKALAVELIKAENGEKQFDEV